jgi:hypothetical protein
MTIEQLAAELERAYYADVAVRVGSGDSVPAVETMAANAYLMPISRRVARAAARQMRQAKRTGTRLQQRDLVSVVARDAERSIRDDESCGSMIAVIGWVVLEKLLWNLAFRFAGWLMADSDRDELICKIGAD